MIDPASYGAVLFAETIIDCGKKATDGNKRESANEGSFIHVAVSSNRQDKFIGVGTANRPAPSCV